MTKPADPVHTATLASPIGRLVIYGTAEAVTEIAWSDAEVGMPAPNHSPVAEAAGQLDAYFRGQRKHFDVPMRPQGSAFQTKVWHALLAIQFGETASYGEIARRVGSVARPVGMACGANPIPVLIPCHRVVAANGRLTGYSGGDGIKTKQILLELENQGQADLFSVFRSCHDAPPNDRHHRA